jgi:thioredoxin-related protein
MRFLLFVTGLVFAMSLGLAANPGARAEARLQLASTDVQSIRWEPWIKKSTGDLSKDLALAVGEGKVLTVMWEQEFCSYCDRMHEVNLKIPDIAEYIEKNFYVVTFDMHGDTDVVSLEGEKMSESKLAKISQVRGTPTIAFFTPDKKEVARMPGYGQPAVFKKVFEFVIEKGYQTHSMIEWITIQLEKEAES